MIVKRDKKSSPVIAILIIVLVAYVVLKMLTGIDNNGGQFSFDVIQKASDDVFKFWQPLNFTTRNIGISLAFGLFGWAAYECLRLQNKKNMQENTYGSAEWQDSSVIAKKKDKDIKDNIILTQTEQVSKNMRTSGMNRHILIVGRPGTGKSRYFFKPNLLNATGCLVITDPKGELLRDCSGNLVRNGYDIKVLNLDDMSSSNHYNPFMYIRTIMVDEVDKETGELVSVEKIKEDDVMTLIDCIMKNTKSDQIETQTGDPFWEKAEMLYLQALCYYMLEEYKDRPLKKNFATILNLIRKSAPDSHGRSELDGLFYEFEKKYGSEHIAVKQYKHFKVSASSPKMMSTIIMTATARLGCFNIKALSDITSDDTMELDRIGMPIDDKKLAEVNSHSTKKSKHGKVAYFIITKPSANTFNFIGTLMYTQLFQQIDENALRCGGSLATPTDMYLDEFRQQGQIPMFQEMLAYVRGLNVGIVICLQSLAQLKEFYKDTWENILDCCDTMMLIGSNTKETNEYFSTLLGKKTWYKKSSGRTFSRQGSSNQNWDVVGRELATIDELAKIEKGHCVLFIANIGAFYSQLYDLTKHPDYKYIYEPWRDAETKQWKYVHNPNDVTEKSPQQQVADYFDKIFGNNKFVDTSADNIDDFVLADDDNNEADDDIDGILLPETFLVNIDTE